jgi:aminoglycoside phosphotransferase (APT) family kinase protein
VTPAVPLDQRLVGTLIAAQFPQWTHMPIRPVGIDGWDNAVFRLGDGMVVHLPRASAYAGQPQQQFTWLPRLAPSLPLKVPRPLGLGEPGDGYPWPWSIGEWIDGEVAAPDRIANLDEFAKALGSFLVALERIDARGAPAPGRDNFFRGATLLTYDAQARQAFDRLSGKIDAPTAREMWRRACASSWHAAPVWIHGDVHPSNLLVRDGELVAVIDFGQMAAGDPACDLAIAWVLFRGTARQSFRETVGVDAATWDRGRGWALWKAAIVAAGLVQSAAIDQVACWDTLGEILRVD